MSDSGRCEVHTLADGSSVRVQGHLPAETVQALSDLVAARSARRCPLGTGKPMPEIAQRMHGRVDYHCGRLAGHDGPCLWPSKEWWDGAPS